MCSAHNEEKSVVAEIITRTLKNMIYKYVTSIFKNIYIDKLNYIIDGQNNTYHKTIKMKYTDVKTSGYIDFTPNWSEEVNNTIVWVYIIDGVNGEEIVGKFYEKEFQKTN